MDESIAEADKGYSNWIVEENKREYPFRDRFKAGIEKESLEHHVDRWHEDERIHGILVREMPLEFSLK